MRGGSGGGGGLDCGTGGVEGVGCGRRCQRVAVRVAGGGRRGRWGCGRRGCDVNAKKKEKKVSHFSDGLRHERNLHVSFINSVPE